MSSKPSCRAELFHQRFLPNYDKFTALFEASANARLRVRQMETMAPLTTSSGQVALPADYLLWRTVRPTCGQRVLAVG